ncbi:MAG: histidine kinase [Burkholderiales bacterium]|nr:histidine kinase [Burkholderiales bacterium]
MQTVLPGYSFVLVTISLVVAAIGSFIAFHTLRTAALAGAGTPWKSVALAAVAMGGIGIWSMHFVGMLALSLPVPHGYSLWETLTSLALAIAATAAAFALLAARPHDPLRLLLSSVLLGLGVCAMHYLGMLGMRFDGYIVWSWPIVLASLVLSVAGAGGALWLVFAAHSPRALRAAPLVMAAAVSGMHYVAMTAAGFVCSTASRSIPGQGVVASTELTNVLMISLVGMMAVLALDQWLWADPHMSRRRNGERHRDSARKS